MNSLLQASPLKVDAHEHYVSGVVHISGKYGVEGEIFHNLSNFHTPHSYYGDTTLIRLIRWLR